MKKTLFIILLGLAACTRDSAGIDMPVLQTGTARLNFSVHAPSMSRNANASRFPSLYEEGIDDITLFLAHDAGAGFVLDSMIAVTQFREVTAVTQAFSLELPTSDVPTKIFVVANLFDPDNGLSAAYASAFPTQGLREDEFVRALSDTWSTVSASASNHVCMYMAGIVELPTIGQGEQNLHIPLLRWVARADVKLDLDADSRPFVPSSLTLWHGYQKNTVVAGEAAYDPENAARVLRPTLADAQRLTPDTGIGIDLLSGDPLIGTTYVGEHEGRTDDQEKLDAPCIILGGYFDGSSTESFYRIDFDSEEADHPFGQVLRNWRYDFTVTKIMSAGYGSAAEAAANPAHSIVLEVQMWDENVQQVSFVDSGDYMYVDTLDVLLDCHQSAQATFTVRSTLPIAWGFDDTTPFDGADDTPRIDLCCSVAITRRVATDPAYTDYTFTVSALADNLSNVRNESGIFISAQSALMKVKAEQRAARITDRVIRVLSLSANAGSMGVYVKDGADVDGNDMRKILLDDDWFGPTGRVRCGGFAFDRFQSGDLQSGDEVDLDELQRKLDATDILVTCYASDPGQEVVDKILAWAQKPYHVLFVMADAGGTSPSYGDDTNVIMRQSLKLPPFDSGLDWYPIRAFDPFNTANTMSGNAALTAALGTDYLRGKYAEGKGKALQTGEPIYAAANAFVMADQTDANKIFMAGPFGLPSQAMYSNDDNFKLWDGQAEWAVPENSSITPLMVLRANIFGYSSYDAVIAKTDAMMIGVDVAHAVVYMGEGQLFSDFLFGTPNAGIAPGIAQSPYYNSLTTLLSNIWGWAVDNVLAQVTEP